MKKTLRNIVIAGAGIASLMPSKSEAQDTTYGRLIDFSGGRNYNIPLMYKVTKRNLDGVTFIDERGKTSTVSSHSFLCKNLHKLGKYPLNCFEIVTPTDYDNVKWIRVPYSGQVWNSYTSERLHHHEFEWADYQNQVAKKNGVENMKDFKGKTILIPDLDKDGKVKSGKRAHR